MTHEQDRRIAALERGLRRQRRLSLGLAGLFAGALGLAAAPQRPSPTLLRGQGLEIVNDQGQVVVRAGAAASEGGRLQVLDGRGKTAFEVIATKTGGQATLGDNRGETSMHFSSNPFGGQLSLLNRAGRLILGLGATQKMAELNLFDGAGHRVASMGVDPDGNGAITIRKSEDGSVKSLGFDR